MRRVPWTRQPPYPVRIDWSNPLTRGLVSAVNIATGRDYVGNGVSLIGGASYTPTPDGIGILSNGSSSYGLMNINQKTYSELTIVAATIPVSLATSRTVVSVGHSSNATPIFRITTGNTNSSKIRFWLRGDNNGTLNAHPDSTNTAFVVGKKSVVSFYAKGTSGKCYCYINGIKDAFSTTTIANTWTINRLSIGTTYFGGSTADFYNGNTPLALLYERELSGEEHRALSDNPWQIFEPYTVLEVPAASGPTSYTLIASGGSYTATGSTAILNRNRKLTANGASYTVTGGTAALLRSKRLTLQGGSYNLTGASATLLRSKRITAQGGSYTLLGSSASIFKSRVLLAGGGSYVLNGQQITITYTPTAGAYTLTALGGSYTITGSSAVLKRNRSLTAQGGSYALSGASSIIYRSRNLIAQGGSYTTTGSVATLHHNKLLIASGGVYSVAGSQASLLRSKLLTAQGGSYTVTGQQANLSRNRILQALGGAYLISGGSVVIQRSGMVWPSPDQVLLGVQYGPTGADYVGTMDVFGIKYDIVTGNLIKPISDKVVMTL